MHAKLNCKFVSEKVIAGAGVSAQRSCIDLAQRGQAWIERITRVFNLYGDERARTNKLLLMHVKHTHATLHTKKDNNEQKNRDYTKKPHTHSNQINANPHKTTTRTHKAARYR